MTTVIVTNVPAIYRRDLYRYLSAKQGIIYFYDRFNENLSYCSGGKPLDFLYRDVGKLSLLFHLVRDSPKTIFCANASPVTALCALYCLLYRRKMIIWWAGTNISEEKISRIRKIYRRIVFGLADEFLCYSEYAEAYLSDQFAIKRDLIKILGNVTMNPERFLTDGLMRSVRQKSDKVIKLLSVGAIIERKNYEFLLKVLRLLADRVPNKLELHLIGEGPDRDRLQELVKAQRLDGVKFVGELKDDSVLEAYAAADIFIHPASRDQWPQVVNEAMATGLPVVVSDKSGVSESLLEVGKELYIVPLQVEQFADTIQKLIEDEALRVEMGTKARAAVKRLYERSISIFDTYVIRNEDTSRP